MERKETINLIREAISIATDVYTFTDEEYDAMHDLLNELENEPATKRSSDDWRGCQGTCDFEEAPNVTGWI